MTNSLQLDDPRPAPAPASASTPAPAPASASASASGFGVGRQPARRRPATVGASGAGRSSGPAGGLEVRLALDRCAGCQECVRACKPDAIGLVPDGSWTVQVDRTRCSGCRRCVPACPFQVITIDGPVRTRHQIVLDHLHDALTLADVFGYQITVGEPLPSTHLTDVCPTPDLAVLRAPRDDTACRRGAHRTDAHRRQRRVLRAPRDDTAWIPFRPPVVDLVVEVIAPSTRTQDLGPKRELYRHLGVGTYWTVDQRNGQVTVHWSARASWFDQLAHLTYS